MTQHDHEDDDRGDENGKHCDSADDGVGDIGCVSGERDHGYSLPSTRGRGQPLGVIAA